MTKVEGWITPQIELVVAAGEYVLNRTNFQTFFLNDLEARAVVQALAANLGMCVVDPYHAVTAGDDAA